MEGRWKITISDPQGDEYSASFEQKIGPLLQGYDETPGHVLECAAKFLQLSGYHRDTIMSIMADMGRSWEEEETAKDEAFAQKYGANETE